MNKILIGIGLILLVGVGWFLFQDNAADYLTEIDDELSGLETELAEIDAAIQAGTLSPEQAADAQAKIVARIDTINTATASGQKAKLTDAQRIQLVDGLERLKQILITHQATLTVIDETVLELPEADRPQLNRGRSGSRNSVAAIATETIVLVEEQVEEIVEEITDEELADDLASSTSETYNPEEETSTSTETTEGSEMDTTSDETAADDDTSADDSNEEASDDESANDPEADASIEADTDFTFSQSQESVADTDATTTNN